jgi:hypothetical protein
MMAKYGLSVIVLQLPTLVVLVAGIALLTTRRATLPPRSVQLGVAGCVAMLVGTLVGLAWSVSLPLLVSQGGGVNFTNVSLLSLLVGGVLTLLHAAGLGLLIAAVLGGVRVPDPPPTAAAPPA